MVSNTTGGYNTANGVQALSSNTDGEDNTATGFSALYDNTSGTENTAIGSYSLRNNTTGDENAACGYYALFSNSTGYRNSAMGVSALLGNTTGYANAAHGYQALYSNTTGFYNTGTGYNALYSNVGGDQNTALGYSAFSTGTAYNNSTALGFNAEPGASNTVRLGDASVSSIGGYAGWTNLSDGRFKTDVQENVGGLDFILKLRPITYHLDMDAIAKFNNTPDSLRLPESEKLKSAELQVGFIAQEVEQAALAVDFDFHGVDKPKNENSHYGLRYAEFVAPLIKAVQEQQEMIVTLQNKNTNVRQLLEVALSRIEALEKQSDGFATKNKERSRISQSLENDLNQKSPAIAGLFCLVELTGQMSNLWVDIKLLLSVLSNQE